MRKKIERRENSREQTPASSSLFLSPLSLFRFSFVLLPPLHCLFHFILTIEPETSLLPSLSFCLFLKPDFFFLASCLLDDTLVLIPHSRQIRNSGQTHFIPISHFQEKKLIFLVFSITNRHSHSQI